MKRQNLLKLIVVVTVVAIAIPLSCGCAPVPAPPTGPAAEPEVINLRFQTTCMPAQYTAYQRPWLDRIEAASNGRVKIEGFTSCELVPDDQLIPALKDGTVDISWTTGPCVAVPIDLAPLEGYIPFGWENAMEAKVLYEDEGLKGLFFEAWEEIDGIKMLGMQTGDPSQLLTSRPVETFEDLAGLKLVGFENVASILDDAGATSIMIPPEEFYLAGQTGVIDGIGGWCGAQEGHDNGWYEVFPYILEQPFGGGWIMWTIFCEDTWNSLPEDIQDLFILSMGDLANATMTFYYGGQESYLQYYTVTTFSDEDWMRLEDIAMKTWDEWAEISPRCNQVIQILKEHKESKR